MADTVREPTYLEAKASGTIYVKWTGLDGDDTGKPVFVAKHPDMQVQAYAGTWGSSTFTFEGTLDERGDPDHADHANAIWSTLTDTTETAISATSNLGVTQVLQGAMWVRPKTASGTGADVVCYLKATIRG